MWSYSLAIAALVPTLAMAAGANFLSVGPLEESIMESFTAGLLIISGTMLIPDLMKTSRGKALGIAGFISAFAMINLIIRVTTHSGIIPSLFFDSLSDGLLLGSMLTKVNSLSNLLPLLIPITGEMTITASSSVSILKSKKSITYAKEWVTLGAGILGAAVILGYFIGGYLNKEFVMGFGSAAMLWLGLGEFMPHIDNKIKEIGMAEHIALFSGIISGAFLE